MPSTERLTWRQLRLLKEKAGFVALNYSQELKVWS